MRLQLSRWLLSGLEPARHLQGVLRRVCNGSLMPGCVPVGRSVCSPTLRFRGPFCLDGPGGACVVGIGCVTTSHDSLFSWGASRLSPQCCPHCATVGPHRRDPVGWLSPAPPEKPSSSWGCAVALEDQVRRSVYRHGLPGESWLMPVSSCCHRIDCPWNPWSVSGCEARQGQ